VTLAGAPHHEGLRDRPAAVDSLALFSVMWALAAVWHLLGNPTGAPAASRLLLTVGIALVLWRPGAVAPLGVLAVGGLATLWGEAPVLGNHWLLVGFVDLAVLLAVVVGAVRRRPFDRPDLARRFLPVARLCLLVFYAFAAFAKLNTAFFDRSVSCAVFYFNESTTSLGLARLQFGGASWVQWAVIAGTATVELSIPVLLIYRRTRHLGVVVGLVFHALLALDYAHQFFDFSSVLAALFVLFLPPEAGTWVAERVRAVRARVALRSELGPSLAHLVAVVPPVMLAAACVLGFIDTEEGKRLGWMSWQVYSLVVIVAVVRFLRRHPAVADHALRPTHAVLLIIPLLVAVNGLTPYTEVKTGYGFTMYANLRTVDGDSNHLLVRATLPLTDRQADLVRVVSTDDQGLQRYADNNYALTWIQFRAFMAEHPGVAVTYERAGERVALAHADEDPALVRPISWWEEKVLFFRPVDLTSPERCQPTFGPAR
jgi:hypothetical protein